MHVSVITYNDNVFSFKESQWHRYVLIIVSCLLCDRTIVYFSFPLPLYSYPPSYTTIPTIVHMIWYWYRIRDMIDSLYYGLLMVVSYEICCLCKRPNTLFRFEYFNRMCDTVRVVLFWSGVTCGRILVSHVLYIACVGITLLFIMPRFNIMCLIRAFFISSISRRR